MKLTNRLNRSSKPLRPRRKTWLVSLLATLSICLTLLSSSLTAFAQDAPRNPDVTPVVKATTASGYELPAGMWVSAEGLALIVTEAMAARKANAVVTGTLALHRSVECPPIPEDATPYDWQDVAVGAGGGATVAAITILILSLTL